ncbi:MAG: hydroxyethylthiazole kinase [Bacteroidales bacterium]|nr:hydroxyethylthiazole kinase [Bacteroidales bacterium]
MKILSDKTPVVVNITNYVAMNFNANALLAIGASPIMSFYDKEMDDLLAIANSLVINIGCLDDNEIHGMHAAAAAAVKYGKPWVLDPVGVGASKVRTETAVDLITRYHPAIVRCNASEIMVLHGTACQTRGVDSAEPVEKARSCAREFAAQHGTVVAVSGAVDFITDGKREAECHKGSPMMAKVTTMGCCASAVCAAFAAVMPPFEAAVHAMDAMGTAGERAAARSEGTGSLAMHFIDELYRLP